MRKSKFQAPVGMHDILPREEAYFRKIYKACENAANFYDFGKIETPMVEQAELFSKGVGQGTEIVEKQMYTLKTKGGDILALRPEGTASVARAFIEHGMHNLPQPVKLWYYGPFFRYERPQLGRFRQFWQFGFEVFGEQSAVVDAQNIQLFYNILKELKFKNLIVEVNSIGCRHCRAYYKKLLVSYFKSRENSLCLNCRKRLRENPLRILDCKEEKCRRIIVQAPQMVDHLCDECKNHFKQVLEFLDELDIPYNLNPYLVRGLDYYTKTVFEIFSLEEKNKNDSGEDNEEKKPLALIGGGRYDNLVKMLGGKEIPACGGAGGIERIMSLLKEKPRSSSEKTADAKIFIAQLGEAARKKSLVLAEKFRQEKIPVGESFSKDSLKTQLGRAAKAEARYCLIIGQREVLEKSVIIRDMKSGNQETVKAEKVVKEIKRRLKK
jgi:histidyl-tRNA synthetase